jgi:hypothetical protein
MTGHGSAIFRRRRLRECGQFCRQPGCLGCADALRIERS